MNTTAIGDAMETAIAKSNLNIENNLESIPLHSIVENANVDDNGTVWSDEMVPLFKNPKTVYRARDAMRDSGEYDGFKNEDNFVCHVEVGDRVRFIERKWSGSVMVEIMSGPNQGGRGWILEWNLNWK